MKERTKARQKTRTRDRHKGRQTEQNKRKTTRKTDSTDKQKEQHIGRNKHISGMIKAQNKTKYNKIPQRQDSGIGTRRNT